MELIKKKLYTKLIISFMLLLVLVVCSKYINAAEYKITDYIINADMLSNGDLHVEEYLKYYFDENMNGLYREMLYKYKFNGQKNDMKATSSRYQANDIQNIKVYTSDTGFNNMRESSFANESTLSNGMRDVYSIQSTNSGEYRKIIKAYSPVNENSYKYVKYEYDLTDVVATYNDANELFWNFLGKDWECYIDNLTINVNWNENLDAYKIFVYPHTYANISDLEIKENSTTLKVNSIYSGTAVDARIVIPRGNINNINKYVDSNYDYNELNKIEQEEQQAKENYYLSNKIFLGIGVFALIFFIYIIIISVKNSNKGKKIGKKIEYFRDIPSEYSLGEYSVLNNKSVGFMDSNLIIATIMDLSERDFLKIESKKKTKKILWGEAEYEYWITLNVESELDKLNAYEKKLLKLLFSGKNNKNDKKEDLNDEIEYTDPKIELNKRFKELSISYSKMSKNRQELYKMNKEYTELFYDKVPSKVSNTGTFGCILILISLIINIFVISPLNIESKAGIIAISAIIYVMYMVFIWIIIYYSRNIKSEHIEGYNKLIGLKKYLKDYSVIKQRYPIEIALWGKYLVFATLLGIADKVSKEFKEELIAQGYNEDYIYSNFIIINMSSHYTQLSTSISSYTGSSSSGGYSGGGSGGGGGGGRRWRCILAFKTYRI